MGKIFLGLHIPKCAGTTILSELKRNFGDGVYQSTSLISNFRESKPDLLEAYPALQYQGYFGHHFCDELLKLLGENLFLFTFFRNPLERALSHYKYINRMNSAVGLPEVNFDQFVKRIPSMTRFILERFPGLVGEEEADAPRWLKAASVLKKFDYVGDSDDLHTFQDVFHEEFGVRLDLSVEKNKAPAEEKEVSFSEKEAIYKSLEEDILLYQWVKELWRESRFVSDRSDLLTFLNAPVNENRLFNFHARSLISEFKANNEVAYLQRLSFSNKDLENNIARRLSSAE